MINKIWAQLCLGCTRYICPPFGVSDQWLSVVCLFAWLKYMGACAEKAMRACLGCRCRSPPLRMQIRCWFSSRSRELNATVTLANPLPASEERKKKHFMMTPVAKVEASESSSLQCS